MKLILTESQLSELVLDLQMRHDEMLNEEEGSGMPKIVYEPYAGVNPDFKETKRVVQKAVQLYKAFKKGVTIVPLNLDNVKNMFDYESMHFNAKVYHELPPIETCEFHIDRNKDGLLHCVIWTYKMGSNEAHIKYRILNYDEIPDDFKDDEFEDVFYHHDKIFWECVGKKFQKFGIRVW